MGLLPGRNNAISWTNRAKCPPIEDCAVQNTVKGGRKGRPTGRQKAAAASLVEQQKATRAAARKKPAPAPEPQPKQGVWPFAGSWSPKGRQRG
jgi:hypothetical protein